MQPVHCPGSVGGQVLSAGDQHPQLDDHLVVTVQDGQIAAHPGLVEGRWLRTGGLVRADDGGVFWVVDRLKELIKYKGYQVAPAELEAVLLAHPDVRDAAVVGVPHAQGGEAPKAFVVADSALDGAELMGWVAARVAPYKKIRQVEFVEEIPRSPSGKILRRLLR
jgi:acyl-coenzyme A synthetase/AMP-(fatty) acid ligase